MVDLNLVLKEDILFKLQYPVNEGFMVMLHVVQVFFALWVQNEFLLVGE